MSLWYGDHERDMRDPKYRAAFEEVLATVRLVPCASFRIPLEGDRLTCGDCGWWIEEHPSRDIEPEECA